MNAQKDHFSKLKDNSEMNAVSRKYGLWICKFARNSRSPARVFENRQFRCFDFYDLSHMFKGHGWYLSADSDKVVEVNPGEGIMVAPGFLHNYGGWDSDYVEDAISFCGPVADYLFDCGIIRNGVLQIGENRRLLQIIELVLKNSHDSMIKANMALQALLGDLYFENKNSSRSASDKLFERLFAEIRKAPDRWWSIAEMAEFCNLSVTHFKRIFKAKTGSTAKQYVDNFKLQIAMEKLRSPLSSIKQISEGLGYSDQFHFSRRFKQLSGLSPEKFREQHIKNHQTSLKNQRYAP